MTEVHTYWVLRTPDGYIAPTGGDWGPGHLPQPDIGAAEAFHSKAAALAWAIAPGQGWTDAKAVCVRRRTSWTVVKNPAVSPFR